MTPWSLLALFLALFIAPCLSLIYRLIGRPGGHPGGLVIELAMFALTAFILWIVRKKEGKSWSSLGLGRPPLWQTIWLTLAGLVVVIAMLAGLLGLFSVLGIKALEGDGVQRPMWLMLAMVIRAGFVEEVTYRGVVIDRMAALTGSRTLGWLLPMILFGLLHFSQGLSGILIAFFAAGILTALFLWKRNLWANIFIHFLVDFVPNILLSPPEAG